MIDETRRLITELGNESNADLAPRPIYLFHPDTYGEFEAQDERQAQRLIDNGWQRAPHNVPGPVAMMRRVERHAADPWQAGLDRRREGGSLTDCPHPADSWEHHAWTLGFARFPRQRVRARHVPAKGRQWGRPTKGTGGR